MSTEIDKRVVQMEFDNKDFERNCQASLTTLEKLKMALNFDGAKGLDSMAKAANKVDLSGLAKGAEAIQVKFSAMQVAGMTAISELTKGLMNFGKKVWDSSFGLMKTGGMARTLKIEQARFQMAALAKNMKGITEDTKAQADLVERMVKAASDAVSGTAYGMDAAAAVTSQLMASGVMDSEIMLDHLKGIAGAASMTGRSFEDIGNIFTTVASNGRLMTMQLRQFSAAGLNLSATLAQSLNKSEEEINQMVTKGEISFEQFSKALSDAFGDAASKADDTFSGVTTNIQAQIKRIGQIFTDPFVEHVVPFLKEVKAAIQRLNGVMQPLGKTFEIVFSNIIEKATENMKNLNVTRLSGIIYGLENIFTTLVLIADAIRKAFMDLFPPKTVDQLTQVAMDFEMFTRQLLPTKETLEGLRQIFIPIFSILKGLFNIVSSIWKNAAKPLLVITAKFLGAIIRLGNALKPFNDRLIQMLTESKFLDNVLQVITATIIVVVDWVTRFVAGIADLFNMMAESDVLKKFAETLQVIGNAIGNVILFALVSLYNIIKTIFSYLNLDNLEHGLNTIGNTLMFVIGVIQQGFLTIFNIIEGIAGTSGILSSVWDVLKEIAAIIKAFITGEDPGQHLEKIKDKLEKLGEALKKFGKQISDTMKEIGVGKLLLMAFAVGIIFLTFALIGFVDQATKFTRAATGIASTFTGLKSAVKTFASYNGVTQVLIGLAIAIGAVTSAISTISEIAGRDEKSLMTAVKVLGVFVLAVMGFAIAITMLQKNLKIDSKGAALGVLTYIAGFAIAIYALAAAVKVISDVSMSLEQAVVVFATIAALMLSLAGVSILLSKFAGEITVGALSLISYALAMKIIVSAFDQMRRLNLEECKKTLLGFIALMVAFGGAMGLASLGGLGIGSFLGFIGAALALKLLVSILDDLASYPWEKISMGLVNMGLIFSPLIAFMVSAAVTNRLAMSSKSLMNDLAKLVLSFSVLLLAVAGIVALTGAMDTNALAKGMVVMSLMGLVLESLIDSVMLPLTDGNFTNNRINITGGALKGLKSMIWGLAGLMLVLTFFIKTMGTTEALRGSIPAILVLSGIFTGLTILVKNMSTVPIDTGITKVGPILAMILGLLSVLTAMTMIVAFLNDEEIAKFSIVGATAMMVAFGIAAIIYAMAQIHKGSGEITIPEVRRTADEVLLMCLGYTAVVLALAGVIKAVSELALTPGGLNNLIPIGIGLAAVIGSIIAFMIVCKKNTNDRFGQTAKGITGLMLGVTAVVGVMAASMIALVYFTKGMDVMDIISIMSMFTLCVVAIIGVAGLIIEKMKSVLYYGSTLIKSGLVFAVIGVAFGIIAGAITACIKVLDGVPAGDVWLKMLALTVPFAALMGGIALILHLAERIDVDGFPAEMYSIGTALLAGAASFAIIAAAMILLIKISTTNINESNVAYVSNIWLAMMVSFGAVWLAIFGFVKIMQTSTINSTDILSLAGSITAASSAILIIATALSLIASISNTITNPGALTGMLVSLGVVTVALLGAMALIFKITKTSTTANWKDYLALGASIAIASTAILIISKAISTLANGIEHVDSTKLTQALVMMGAALIAFITIMTILAVVSSEVNSIDLLAMSVALPIAASSLLIIAEAIVMMTQATRELSPTEIIKLGAILVGLSIVFGVLVTLGGIIGGVSSQFADGVLKTLAAFALFQAGIAAFALAADLFVDAIIKINDADLDTDRIASNATAAIQGVARAIRDNSEEILAAVGMIIVGIMAILGAQQIKMALQAVAFITSFVIGLAAAMPIILAALDSMFDQIIEKFDDPEMADKWYGAGHTIGKLIVNGLIGAFLGIGETIAAAIVDGITGSKAYQILADYIESGASSPAEFIRMMSEIGKSNDEAIKESIKELNDIAGENLYDTKRSVEEWADILDYVNTINTEMKNAQDHGGLFTEETLANWDEAVKGLRIPEEYMDLLTNEYDGNKQRLLKALTPTDSDFQEVEVSMENLYGSGPQQNVQHLTLDIEDANTAITETGNASEEASEKTEQSFTKTLSDVADKAKTEGGNIGANIASGLESFLGKDGIFGNVFGDIDITKYTGDLKVFGFDAGDIIGQAAGKQIDKDIKSYLTYWQQEAMEIVSNDAYQYSGGKSGLRWQTWRDENGSAFSNADAAARYKYNEYLKETNDSLDASQAALKENGWSMKEYTEAVLDGTNAVGEFGDGLGDMVDDADAAQSKLEEFRDGLRDSIASAMHGIFDEVKEQEYISPEEMLNRMWENTRQVGEWARNIATLAARGMSEGLLNELKDMGPQGAAKVQAFVDMTDEQLEMANRRWKTAEFMPDYGTKKIEDAYRNAGFNASLGFKNGIDPNAANDAATQLGTNSLDALMTELDEHSPSGKTKQMGIWASQGLAMGLTSQQSQSAIRAQSLAVANLLLNTLKNNMKPQSFQQLGVNVIQGFSTGISNSIPQILSKVTAFCGQIINAFQRVLRMHSPSKVMEELGEYTMDGFGIGFEDGAENVEKLSDQAANDILNRMKANIAAITNGWSEENAYQPVIRPVFDMEAINQGFTDIQSWFANSEGLNLNGNLSRLTPTTRDDNDASTQQIINAINGINNDDVVREISSLRDDISNLQSAITSMQVVLNTGTLVGQLVEPIDKALGSKALYNSRGRY